MQLLKCVYTLVVLISTHFESGLVRFPSRFPKYI